MSLRLANNPLPSSRSPPQHSEEICSHGLNMVAQALACRMALTVPGKPDEMAMLTPGALSRRIRRELHAGIAVGLLQQACDHSAGLRKLCTRVQGGMQLLIQHAPLGGIPRLDCRLKACLDYVDRCKICRSEFRDRIFKEARLEQHAQVKYIIDFAAGKLGDHGSSVGHHLHEPLRFKLKECFAHRDAADTEACGKRILPQRRTCWVGVTQNLLAQSVNDCASKGAMRQLNMHSVDENILYNIR